MKTQNRILTLINVKEPMDAIIESSVNLAKTYQAELKFLYVQKVTDPTRTESQLSVMRTLANEKKVIEKFRQKFSRTQKEHSIKMDYSIANGKVKKTIKSELESYSPDLIVVGKRNPSMYRLIGSQVTEFVLKNFDGPLLIAHPSRAVEIKEDLSVGVLNDVNAVVEHNVTQPILRHSKEPVKLFQIADEAKSNSSVELGSTRTINFTFDNNPNAFKNLSNYVNKNNVHLVFVDRPKKSKINKNVTLKEVLKNINTSMLMVGSNETKNLIKI